MKVFLVAVATLVGCRTYAKKKTVSDIVQEYQSKVQRQLKPSLSSVGLTWPVKYLALVALKSEKTLEVWGSIDEKIWKKIKAYPVLAASGVAGPKMKEGDRQVPEGAYAISGFNPNSKFHLSLRVDYPNAEDLIIAAKEDRNDLGGDIFIHGDIVSVGCLAMGDEAIEEIFILAAQSSRKIPVLIAPRDFRKNEPNDSDWRDQPSWIKERYLKLAKEMKYFL